MTQANSSLILAVLASLFSSGCGGTTTGNPTISTSTASEIAASSVSGAVNSSEPNGTLAVYTHQPARSLLAELFDFVNPLPTSIAAVSCPLITNTTCSSGSIVLNYSSCTYGSSSTIWDGSQTIQFSGSCASVTLPNLANQTLTRTFGSNTTETTAAGVATTVDTASAAASGWDSSVTGLGTGQTVNYGSCTSASSCTRTIAINGMHLRATYRSVLHYDHTISSTAMTVSGAGTSRTVSVGTITVQHNLAKYTAKAQITTPLTYSKNNCCHPVSGVITSTLSGSLSGTETLTFTGATTGVCGTATVVSSDGLSSSVTLSHCF